MSEAKKPSQAQRKALENLAEGRYIRSGIYGRSSSGGFTATLRVLRERGWITQDVPNPQITEAGRNALEDR